MRIMHLIEETRGIWRIDRKNIFNERRRENEIDKKRKREIKPWKLQQRKWSEN